MCQIESAIRECAYPLFLGGNAIEIDKIVRASREQTAENARVKISARRWIHIDELRPVEITFVL